MAKKPAYLKNVDRILSHIAELDQGYSQTGISNYDMLYAILSSNDIFLKFAYMQILLIGENCKGITRSLENKPNGKETELYKVCNKFRLVRNSIAHNYYSLSITSIYRILTSDIKTLKRLLKKLKYKNRGTQPKKG